MITADCHGDRRYIALRQRRQDSEPDPASFTGPTGELRASGIAVPQDRQYAPVEAFGMRMQAKAPPDAGTLEQLLSEFVLQRAQSGRDGWLGPAQCFRRTLHATVFDDGDEEAQ